MFSKEKLEYRQLPLPDRQELDDAEMLKRVEEFRDFMAHDWNLGRRVGDRRGRHVDVVQAEQPPVLVGVRVDVGRAPRRSCRRR